jgi:hypothetical protein
VLRGKAFSLRRNPFSTWKSLFYEVSVGFATDAELRPLTTTRGAEKIAGGGHFCARATIYALENFYLQFRLC